MINKVNVTIIDDNVFFSEGIKYILIHYFLQHGRYVNFVAENDSTQEVDFLFSSAPLTRRVCYCQMMPIKTHHATRFFSIRSRKHRGLSLVSPCVLETGTLYRRQRVSAVYKLLDSSADMTSNKIRNHCRVCSGNRLTRREREVLAYLRNGTSQTEVAEQMHLSVKTVNAHKQSVMKKLDLKKKHDFIYWLMKV
ncbi:hypothetical protein FBF86_20920 [Serratia marcescens]|uniref:helix-turn-helix transcriptional regulator n=1 Tax=Serratia marcescens TaxID=615 RepID=UPI00114DA4A8|nr:LuxR C-terminal-related transcriptional regulator [Serratia marcescens]QDI20294.1 hypothetical protein FBF86_20920 [Serratia marcescens]QDI30038.1 hypothetical protein FG169_20920 [Serratia marcescens]QDI44542.1 hypothetical protein FG172_21145 [Serratia marcescens]QDI58967.1 hypothetical protein FG175_21145 [Serratia marcescens]QLJ67559.1 response regulator transcription factor [Serratia marcescens]